MRVIKNKMPIKDSYTIGEASNILNIDQHVIRFWSNKFSQYIKPLRKAGQRRSYSQKDLDMLKTIKELLHDKGMSIKGAHLLLKDKKNVHNIFASAKESDLKLNNIITKLENISSFIEAKLVVK